MKINNLAAAFILSVGMASTVAHAANEGHGKITFYGSIIDAACSIYPGDDDQHIPLGQVSTAALADGKTSTPVNFEIRLDNCALAEEEEETTRATAANAVQIAFEGDYDGDLLGIVGTASGAGVVITDNANVPVTWGVPSAGQTLIEGLNTLSFHAHLKGNGETVVPGEFESFARFTLTYL